MQDVNLNHVSAACPLLKGCDKKAKFSIKLDFLLLLSTLQDFLRKYFKEKPTKDSFKKALTNCIGLHNGAPKHSQTSR